MNNLTASRRRDYLRRVAFWLRSCDDDGAVASHDLTRRYVAKAREAMDELMLDMFGDEQESEPDDEGRRVA